ncbi:hypothetical protein LWI29_032109 [Acer saccharum]|uniref:Uncharacterized protein n=1 Tax=Acer saccharum TaxID=4024 RepID=A0AA39SFY0_ACESA|nr:hypothetical protein LWI29_032109 [Acer saccharum]
MKVEHNSVQNLKVQSSLEERREGTAGGLQILSSDDVRRGEDDGGLMAVRFGSFSGHGSGLLKVGPAEEGQISPKQLEEKGIDDVGPGQDVGPVLNKEDPHLGKGITEEMSLVVHTTPVANSVPLKSTARNWKRMARAKKSDILSYNQSKSFRNLQTVSTKGKKSSQGKGASPTSKSKFILAGKRSGLGNYHSSSQSSSLPKGNLLSSLKHWEKKKNSSNNGQGSIQKIDRAPSSPEFSAQNSAELGSSGAGSDEPVRTLERPRLVWTDKFFDAVAHLGIKNAVAKTIMQLKNDDGDNNGGGGNKNKKKDSYLELLDRGSLEFLEWPESFKGLSNLKGLSLKNCKKLIRMPELPSSIILVKLKINHINLKPPDLAGCSIPEKLRKKTTADADGDADNDGGDADNDGGDDRDNNGGGGDKNKKKGGGHSDGEGNGDGGDKAEGGDGEEKGMNNDCTGQLGFGYRCTYHAGYENGYPVEQLHALIMFFLFCSENMINYCSIMPPVRDVTLMICA